MESKWPEKLEKDEDEFDNYSKGKYFADKAFFEAIVAGKYFEEETINSVNVKANSEHGTKSCVAPACCTNKKDVHLETAKVTTKKLPNGEHSSKTSA